MNKTKLVIIITSTFIIALLVYLLVNNKQSDSTIGLIDGKPLEVKEFELLTEMNASADPQKIVQKHIHSYIIRRLAVKYGIIADASYEQFLRLYELENRRRKNAIAANEVVFGPQQFSITQYYDYFLSQLILQMKEKNLDTLEITDSSLQQFYEDHKPEFKRIDDREFILIELPADGQLDLLEKAVTQIRQDMDINAVASEFGWKTEEFMINEDTIHTDYKRMHQTMETAVKLKPGEVSDVIREGDIYKIIQCISYKDRGYRPYAEVKGAVRRLYAEESFNRTLDQLISDAKLEPSDTLGGKSST